MPGGCRWAPGSGSSSWQPRLSGMRLCGAGSATWCARPRQRLPHHPKSKIRYTLHRCRPRHTGVTMVTPVHAPSVVRPRFPGTAMSYNGKGDLMRLRKFVRVAAFAALPALLPAQSGPRGYHAVACVKLKPGASTEFQKFAAGDLRKLQQSFADSGRIAAWFLLKYAMPQGSSAPCDYVTISVFAGAPPAPAGPEEMGAALEKAGVAMSGQQLIDKRSSLVNLVSYEMWQNQAAVGTLQKGDYVVFNHMKVHDIDEWIAYEKKIWKPIAESLAKDGIQRGWTLNVQRSEERR